VALCSLRTSLALPSQCITLLTWYAGPTALSTEIVGIEVAAVPGDPARVVATACVRVTVAGSGTVVTERQSSLPYPATDRHKAMKAAIACTRLATFRRLCLLVYDGGPPVVRLAVVWRWEVWCAFVS
jgi:hypothetical protein